MATVPGKSNAYEPEKVKGFVAEIEGHFDELTSAQSAYMNKARKIRESITAVYDEAKDAGIPTKELRANVKRRQLEEKIEALREKMEADSQEQYDMLRHALGDLADTPLGQAATGPAPATAGMPANLTEPHTNDA